jgi:hypothetical protein
MMMRHHYFQTNLEATKKTPTKPPFALENSTLQRPRETRKKLAYIPVLTSY